MYGRLVQYWSCVFPPIRVLSIPKAESIILRWSMRLCSIIGDRDVVDGKAWILQEDRRIFPLD